MSDFFYIDEEDQEESYLGSYPSCFHGVTLRSGVKYRDLQNHTFTFCEILWLCESIVEDGKNGYRNYVQRYNIARQPVKKWLRQFRANTLVDEGTGMTLSYGVVSVNYSANILLCVAVL
jgi:hypothetical protein